MDQSDPEVCVVFKAGDDGAFPDLEAFKKKWPQTWQHKETEKKFRVNPWWECISPLLSDEDLNGSISLGTELFEEGRKYRIGALIQIGWLLENEHGVWMGVGIEAAEYFKLVETSELPVER